MCLRLQKRGADTPEGSWKSRCVLSRHILHGKGTHRVDCNASATLVTVVDKPELVISGKDETDANNGGSPAAHWQWLWCSCRATQTENASQMITLDVSNSLMQDIASVFLGWTIRSLRMQHPERLAVGHVTSSREAPGDALCHSSLERILMECLWGLQHHGQCQDWSGLKLLVARVPQRMAF